MHCKPILIIFLLIYNLSKTAVACLQKKGTRKLAFWVMLLFCLSSCAKRHTNWRTIWCYAEFYVGGRIHPNIAPDGTREVAVLFLRG